MYKKIKPNKTTLVVNTSKEGETIEQKVRRITVNKEPIKDGAPIIYTAREAGVIPELDPRTDRFERAIDEMDSKVKHYRTKRDERLGETAKKNMDTEKKGETSKEASSQPVDKTGNNNTQK